MAVPLLLVDDVRDRPNEHQDEDVQKEKEKVLQGGAGDCAVKLLSLTKEYHGRRNKIAVDNQTLAITPGELFGLLGSPLSRCCF